MKEILEKHGFIKTEKNKLIYWDDYLLKDINPEYGYFLYATLSIPKKDWGRLDYNFSTLVLHRHYDYDRWVNEEEYYDINKIYEGLIENEEDLKFILTKTGIKDERIKPL